MTETESKPDAAAPTPTAPTVPAAQPAPPVLVVAEGPEPEPRAEKPTEKPSKKDKRRNGEPRDEAEAAEAKPAKEERKEKKGKEGKEAKEPKPRKDKKDKKRLKKLRKAMEGGKQPLAAWERYRALGDAFDMEQDLVDLADHKARFALIIMGALNTVTLFIGTRSEAVALAPPALRPWVTIYAGAYALVALYFFVQAIESLRPRAAKARLPYPGLDGREDHPLGVRFYEDILARDVAAYREAWHRIRLGQLNAEVAQQVHLIAQINKRKYAALAQLYAGLKVMTLLAALLVTSLAGMAIARERNGSWSAQTSVNTSASTPTQPDPAGGEALGGPVVFGETGALEPSGITYVATSDRLWVVGDEGSLVEIDTEGRSIGSVVGKDNLEDVAWHPPSGLLVLLSEKKSQLLLFDPVTRRDVGRIKIDAEAVLSDVPGDKNQGFEGLAFRPLAGRAGGGIFYLTHQRQPAMVMAVVFDPQSPPARLDAAAVVARFRVKGYKDLTAITWSPELGRLLVIGDDKDRLLVLKEDGTREAEIPLPGLQQEGLAFDDQGRLWVADDRGGVLRLDGALETIRRQIGAPARATGPREGK